MLDLKGFRTLQSEAEYNAALKEVRPYFEDEPEEGSEEAAHFDALVLLIEQYEARHYPIPTASPVEVISRRWLRTITAAPTWWPSSAPKHEQLIF